MQQVGGIWLPDHERHLVEWMQHPKNRREVDGRLTYQYPKFEAAMQWVRNWRCAIDVGAHVGLWSMHLAKRFERVHAFEPVAAHRECFEANVPEFRNNLCNGLHACALGASDGTVAIHTAPTSSGDSWVSGPGEIPMITLDYLQLDDVDFIKIDCEGYELQVLKGAEETLRRCHPCVIVEQKAKPLRENFGIEGQPAVDFLRSLGAFCRTAISGDFIVSWDA